MGQKYSSKKLLLFLTENTTLYHFHWFPTAKLQVPPFHIQINLWSSIQCTHFKNKVFSNLGSLSQMPVGQVALNIPREKTIKISSRELWRMRARDINKHAWVLLPFVHQYQHPMMINSWLLILLTNKRPPNTSCNGTPWLHITSCAGDLDGPEEGVKSVNRNCAYRKRQ